LNGVRRVNRPLIVGIAGALVVLVAILMTFFVDREPDRPLAPTPKVDEPISSQPNEVAPKQPASKKQVTPKAGNASRASDNFNVEHDPAGSLMVKPSFDIVRVDPQGNAVIAGRAVPNSLISVRKGNEVIGTVKADKRGQWVLLPENILSSGTHELTVMATGPDGTEVFSEKRLILVVPDSGNVIADQPGSRDTGSIAVAIPNSAEETPFILSNTGDISAVKLTLDVIDYGARVDAILLSGRAKPHTEVRVYLDNNYIGRTGADGKGTWRLNLSVDIPTGLYRLRVDRVGPDGQTLERVELPFLRAIPVGDIPDSEVVFVQPGNSLWRLARNVYGSGLRYTEIYKANKDQIRDPDLIYPGQVFFLPKTAK